MLITGKKSDEFKLGFLTGYQHSMFDFDMYNLYYPDSGVWLYNDGTKVLTYQITYDIPYIGLAASIANPVYGLNLSCKYSFWARAHDMDNHLLRGLTFYADYDKNGSACMVDINGFWQFARDWKLRLGAEGTFIRIDGETWEDQRNPGWDGFQATDARYWIFRTGLEYKF